MVKFHGGYFVCLFQISMNTSLTALVHRCRRVPWLVLQMGTRVQHPSFCHDYWGQLPAST
jgi:hypothetical protein